MHVATDTDSTLSESVASEIRAELARQRITQSTLAERLGEAQTWVSRRVNPGSTRRQPLSLDDLVRIAAVPKATCRVNLLLSLDHRFDRSGM